MRAPYFSFSSALLWTSLNSNFAFGQSSTSPTADGLSTTAASKTTASIGTVTIDGTPSTFSVQFTVPASAQNGQPILPNINDPKAVDAQDVCPGYKASNAKTSANGLTATLSLAGKACNVYGTDVDSLKLTVEYQSNSRLSVNIAPTYIVSGDLTHLTNSRV